MSRLVTRERVEQLRGLGQGEREDQPVRLGGRERCLGRGSGGVSIPQGEVRDAGEQMRFDERERGAGRGVMSRTSPSASNAAAGSPSAMQITARALSMATHLARVRRRIR